MYSVEVSHEISYGHRLLHTPGKCQRLHGHNAYVTIVVGTQMMYPPSNMVVDFAMVKQRLRECLSIIDHNTVLNEKDPYMAIDKGFVPIEGDPTAERMAQWVFERIGVNHVKSVTWQETRDCSATYTVA